jgi:hypothetical protein
MNNSQKDKQMNAEISPQPNIKEKGFDRVTSLAIGFITLTAYAFLAYHNYNFNFDDALIYLRYIDNAVAGNGLVYNVGVKFNGLTSPAFTLPLAGLSLITHNPKLSSWLICSICIFLSTAVYYSLFRDAIKDLPRFSHRVSVITFPLGALLALALPYFFLTYGMETGLYALISGLAIRQYIRQSYGSAAFLLGLLIATRTEGCALVFAIGVHQLFFRRLPPRIPALIALFIAAPVLVFSFNYVYYGAPMPETGMAKLWQGQSGLWGKHSFLNTQMLYEHVFGSSQISVLGVTIFAIVGIVGLGRSTLNVITIVYLSLYTFVFIILNIPNYHWYYGPYFSVLILYATAGITLLASILFRHTHWIIACGLMMLFTYPLMLTARHSIQYDLMPKQGFTPYIKIGSWLNQNTSINAKIAAIEIGTIGYYSNRYIIDILGLVNEHNARAIGEKRLDGWLDYFTPDYLIVHTPVWPMEYSIYASAARLGVEEVCNFNQPGYQLFRISRNPGHSKECNGNTWGPVTSTGRYTPLAIEHDQDSQIGDVQQTLNMLRIHVALVSSLRQIDSIVLAGTDAYGTFTDEQPNPAGSLLHDDLRHLTLNVFFRSEQEAAAWRADMRLAAKYSDGGFESIGNIPGQPANNEMVSHAEPTAGFCALDSANGTPVASQYITRSGSLLSLSGWAMTTSKQPSSASSILLRGDAVFTFPYTPSIPRNDVATALSAPQAIQSGFNMHMDLNNVPAGLYQIMVLISDKQHQQLCDTQRRLEIQ